MASVPSDEGGGDVMTQLHVSSLCPVIQMIDAGPIDTFGEKGDPGVSGLPGLKGQKGEKGMYFVLSF